MRRYGNDLVPTQEHENAPAPFSPGYGNPVPANRTSRSGRDPQPGDPTRPVSMGRVAGQRRYLASRQTGDANCGSGVPSRLLGRPLRRDLDPPRPLGEPEEDLPEIRRLGLPLLSPALRHQPHFHLVSRQLLERFGVFDETFPVCEDYDLWLRISVSKVLKASDTIRCAFK